RRAGGAEPGRLGGIDRLAVCIHALVLAVDVKGEGAPIAAIGLVSRPRRQGSVVLDDDRARPEIDLGVPDQVVVPVSVRRLQECQRPTIVNVDLAEIVGARLLMVQAPLTKRSGAAGSFFPLSKPCCLTAPPVQVSLAPFRGDWLLGKKGNSGF